jgi:hypothetical protein
LAAIAEAKATIQARAKERFEREQADYEAKQAQRAAKQAATGKKPRGKPPAAPQEGPQPDEQINLTDEDSRIMLTGGRGFEQCYNAQAAVDSESMLVLAPAVTQAANDKEQMPSMVAQLHALPEGMNHPKQLLADTGYFSAANVDACFDAGIEPLIAVARDQHHPAWRERFEEPAALPEAASRVDTMKHTLKTQAGRAAYAQRKQTVEPVFGIIKSVMGFRQFMLRGLTNVGNEWTLVCLAWNLKRMAVLRHKSVQMA